MVKQTPRGKLCRVFLANALQATMLTVKFNVVLTVIHQTKVSKVHYTFQRDHPGATFFYARPLRRRSRLAQGDTSPQNALCDNSIYCLLLFNL